MTADDHSTTPRTTQITVVNRLSGGAAFGVRLDNGEHMFISAKIASLVDADIGKNFVAHYVDNVLPEKTRWFAVRLTPVPETTVTEDEVRSELWDLIWGRGETTEDECIDSVVAYMRKLGLQIGVD